MYYYLFEIQNNFASLDSSNQIQRYVQTILLFCLKIICIIIIFHTNQLSIFELVSINKNVTCLLWKNRYLYCDLNQYCILLPDCA